MKSIFCSLIIITFISSISFAQGRGDQIFDESVMHEIRITSALELSELSDIFFGEIGLGNYTYTPSTVYIDNHILDSVGVRVKGGLSSFDLKKPLKLDFNYFLAGQRYDGIKKLNLHQGNMDPSFIREAISYGIMRNAGVKTARTSFANVYFNDTYQGVYTLVEQIDDNFIKDRFASNNGALYKTGFIGLDLKYEIDNSLPYSEFVSAIGQIPTELLHEQLQEYLDIESFLRFFAAEIFVNAVDGPLTVDENYYIYYEPKAGTYVYIPWDYNLSLYGGANHPLFANSANFLFNRALSNPVLRERYLDIFCQLLQYNFDQTRLEELISSYEDLLNSHVPNDPFLDKSGNWEEGVSAIREVISSRYLSLSNEVNEALNECPELINPLNPQDIVINEIVASNDINSGISDPNGGHADWIELYNNTTADVELSQFYLSNDGDVLKHWRFPVGTTIPANSYLIIWADRDVNEEGLHADFKLNKSRGELYLSFENGEIIDSLIFSDQETNIGYARVPNGVGSFQKQESTFGSSNDPTTILADSPLNTDSKVYPNPVQVGNEFNVYCPNANFIHIQINTLDGVVVWNDEVKLMNGKYTAQTTDLGLQFGPYIVQINNPESKNIWQHLLIAY